MDATAIPTMHPPRLESLAARAGVAVLVILSLVIGYDYFQSQGDEQLAWVTVAAEIIAFAGLVCVRYQWRRSRGWALAALALTLLAAAWCGMTMYEKIAADGRASALEAAQATLPYRTAAREYTAASEALSAKLAESPPIGIGPQTLAAWEASQAASVARLTAARDNAEARLEEATPATALDVFAIIRGVGVELIKLLGFAAFGLLTPLETAAATPARRPRQSFWRKALAWFGIATMGLGFGAVAAAETAGPVSSQPETPAPVASNVVTFDVKTRVFSLYDTGVYTGPGWAERLARDAAPEGTHPPSRSSIYRWIGKREAERSAV